MARLVGRLSLAPLLGLCALQAAACFHDPGYRTLVPSMEAADGFVVRDVRVFTATDAGVLERQDVFVDGDRITRVEPTGTRRSGRRRVIDGRGRTLLPGLIDLHVHISMTSAPSWYPVQPDVAQNLQSYVYAGVTRVLDLGGPVDVVASWAERSREGDVIAPRIHYAGRLGAAPGGYPLSMVSVFMPPPIDRIFGARLAAELTDAASARAFVRDNAWYGAQAIKVARDEVPVGGVVLPEARVAEVVEAAHARGLPVFVHVGTVDDALAAARAGADVLAHVPYRGPITPAQAARICAGGRGVTTTLGAWERPTAMQRGEVAWSALTEEIESAEVLRQYREINAHADDHGPRVAQWAMAVARDDNRPANLRALLDAGCRLLVASDSAIPGSTAGSSLHEELALLQRLGIEPERLLRAVTADAADFLRAERAGRIAEGFDADLLLVEGNPLDDVEHTARIAEVALRGRLVHRQRPPPASP
jgi:imidazolonepropionase-like amidohydrolase